MFSPGRAGGACGLSDRRRYIVLRPAILLMTRSSAQKRSQILVATALCAVSNVPQEHGYIVARAVSISLAERIARLLTRYRQVAGPTLLSFRAESRNLLLFAWPCPLDHDPLAVNFSRQRYCAFAGAVSPDRECNEQKIGNHECRNVSLAADAEPITVQTFAEHKVHAVPGHQHGEKTNHA